MTSRITWDANSALAPGARVVPVVLIAGVPVVLTPSSVTPTTTSASTPDPLWWPGAGLLGQTLPDGSTFDPVKPLLDAGQTWEVYEQANIIAGDVRVEALTFTLFDPDNAATALLSIRDSRDGAFLTADASDSATSITLASTGVFPSSGIAAIGSETVTYSGKTGTTLTGLTRGAYGSRARLHTSPASHRPVVAVGGPRHWQGRLASVWYCVLSDDGTTLRNPTLVYLGVVGAGIHLVGSDRQALTRWSIPLDHVTMALTRKIGTTSVEVYGVAHYEDTPEGHPLGIFYVRDSAAVHVSLTSDTAYPHDGGWHPDWPSFARAANVYATTATGGLVFVTSSPSLVSVRFSGTDAHPIDGSIDAPWGSPEHWEGHCTTVTGWGYADPPQAFQHLEGRLKIGSSEDFARIPTTLGYPVTTTDGVTGTARLALVADTDSTPGCIAIITNRDATTQELTVQASLPGRGRMSAAEIMQATRITSRTQARLGVVVSGGNVVACLRATALALDALTGSGAYDSAVDWDDLERAMSASPSAFAEGRAYRFTGDGDTFLSVLVDEARVRGMVLSVRRGRITARRLQSFADVESAVATITEGDTIAPGGQELTPEVIDNTEPTACSVEFQVSTPSGAVRTVTVTDTTFQGEFGDGETIKVGALRYLPPTVDLPDVTPGLVGVAQQILGPAAEPYRVVRISVSPTLMDLQPGDLVTFTHSRIPSWSGTRGLTSAVCQVMEVRKQLFGGRLRPTVALRIGSGTRAGYAPSVLVAAGGISGTALTVDTSTAWGATCFAQDTDARGDASVTATDGFEVGDTVVLQQIGTRTPVAPETRVIASVSTVGMTFTVAPSATMVTASSAQYGVMVTLQSYASATARQRSLWAFVADKTSGTYSTGDAATRWSA